MLLFTITGKPSFEVAADFWRSNRNTRVSWTERVFIIMYNLVSNGEFPDWLILYFK